MNEITKIIIDNYQSHEHTEIIPAPSGMLTVLVGHSDGGKTATQRAERWLFYNLPDGDDFIRVGANIARVRIDYASGHSVIRSKSHKGLNRYEILYPDRDPEKFEGFGRTVPLEVQQITGVRPVEIGDMTININLASQLEGPFLGSNISAPARAKVLGKLAGTEEVDYAAKSCGTDLYRRRQDKERHQNDETRLTKNIEQYAYLEELGTKIQAAEILLTSIKEKSERLTILRKLRDQRTEVEAQWGKAFQAILTLSHLITSADPLLVGAAQKIDRYQRLQALNVNWAQVIEQISKVQGTLDRTQRIDEAALIHANLCQSVERFWSLTGSQSDLGILSREIATEQAILDRTASIGEAGLILSCAVKHETRRSYLQGRREALCMIDFHLQSTKKTLDATQDIDHAILVGKTVQDNLVKLRALRGASERYDTCVNAIIMQDMRLSKLAGIDEAQEILDTLNAKIARRNTLHAAYGANHKVTVFLGMATASMEKAEQDEKRLITDYKNTLLAAGVCPVCGSQITKELLKEAI